MGVQSLADFMGGGHLRFRGYMAVRSLADFMGGGHLRFRGYVAVRRRGSAGECCLQKETMRGWHSRAFPMQAPFAQAPSPFLLFHKVFSSASAWRMRADRHVEPAWGLRG